MRGGDVSPVVVRRAGDPLPDRQFTLVFNDMTINNLPAGPDFRATVGERIEIIMVTHGEYCFP